MNIGNSYSSWMHNTPQAGYGNRYGQTDKAGAEKAYFGGKEENDSNVINDAAAGKTEAEGTDEEKEKSDGKNTEDMTLREQILAHMEEMAKKVKEGKVEPSFQIGGQTFTIREWDKLLADFDDAEEALQELMKEQIVEAEKQAAKEAARRKAEGSPDGAGSTVVTNVSVPEAAQPKAEAGGSVANPKTEAGGSVASPAVSAADTATKPAKSSAADQISGDVTVAVTGAASGSKKEGEVKGDNVTDVEVTDPEELEKIGALLTGEVSKCTYPTDDPKNKHWFITCYGQDGIICREAYMENGKWVNRSCWDLPYTEPGQREKVLAFIQRFPQDANLRFASHEEFWKDFLAGEIDEDDFVNFFETSTDKDGVPHYTYEKDGSTYVDREKVKYAKYMNDFGAHFYTAEEMDLIWRGIIHENRKGLQKISDYDGQMTIPAGTKTGDGESEDDDLKTQIITKPDGSVVLQIETNFGVMEVEVTEAQKFGLRYNPRPGFDPEETRFASPFARGAGAAAYEAAGL